MTPAEIRELPDPLERAQAAQGFIGRGEDAIAEARTIRDDAIADLLVAGNSQRQVAQMLGFSPAHIAQVAKARRLRSTRTVTRP